MIVGSFTTIFKYIQQNKINSEKNAMQKVMYKNDTKNYRKL